MLGSATISSGSKAAPGITIPETTRKREWEADIAVRSDGLTTVRNGRPPKMS